MQLESIARAGKSSSALSSSQLEALKGKGLGKGSLLQGRFTGTCGNCGKTGHKKADCYLPGGGAHKPGKGGGKDRSKGAPQGKGNGGKAQGKGKGDGKRACFECGMTNHIAKDCRSSEEKKRKYKESLKKGRAQEFQGGDLNNELGLGDLFDFDKDTRKDREDKSDRVIAFNVDSGATRTVVKKSHPAARGYKIHKDEQTGHPYNTAGKQQIRDEGRRILQVKQEPGQDDSLKINTRVAEVRNSLLSPSEMAKRGYDTLLRNEDGYAIHRETGKTHKFDRTTGGWKFTVELEAPEEANKMWKQRKLAELKPQGEDWKAKASKALKEMLGMTEENGSQNENMLSKRAVQGFVQAFERIAAAQENGTDPTIYPFARQRKA